ncbi:E1-E2 ATPase-domain-containing protein [Aspergillus heterothallicus]
MFNTTTQDGQDDAGHAAQHSQSPATNTEDPSTADEFTCLVKFVFAYREFNHTNTDEGEVRVSRVWYAPWRKKRFRWKHTGGGGRKFPDDWVITDIRQGLSDANVTNRRNAAGFNELTAAKQNPIGKFISSFQGPILYVMELAVLLAAGLEDWIDFGVIIGILCLNAAVGWYQEMQAADVVASLKANIAMRATVVHEGQEADVLARELVPGDVIVIDEGQTVPADAKVICAYKNCESGWKDYNELVRDGGLDAASSSSQDDDHDDAVENRRGHSIVACDHSVITGESLAVDRYVGDTVFYSTGCKRGKAYVVVQATGPRTFVGKTAAMVQNAKDTGYFKMVMDCIGTSLLVLVMAWILAMWIGVFYRNIPIASPWEQTLLFYTLELMIIEVPVGPPVATTTTLTVETAYLAKKKAIVQKLTAIESLSGVDILCSDKTGTLTANRLSIREPFVAENVDVNWMFAVAALASSHNVNSLDPIDKVTVLSLKQIKEFHPFNPVSKRIVAVATCNGVSYTCTKGAPKAVLQLTNSSEAKMYKEKATEFASREFRSLGVATIAEAQKLGIQVKMLTGDAIAIAKETCTLLALGTKVFNSEKLIGGGHGAMAEDLVERADGFAEVFPEHKYQVVPMLQERGHLIARKGDGVNDAPSLKKADCGIAVEGVSKAAQSAADIIFLEPGLLTIIDSIKVAGQIFHRMKAYIQYQIALCLHLEIYLTTAIIILNESIRSDLVVFLALFADLATVAVAYDNASYELRPVEWQLPKIWIISVILGILLAAATWGSIQEVIFLKVALTENWLIFVTRGGDTWPSTQLVGAILCVDALASIFCLFGWFLNRDMVTNPLDQLLDTPKETTNGWTDIVTYALNKIRWLDDLGRQKRSRGEVQYVQESETGSGRFFLSSSKEEEEAE